MTPAIEGHLERLRRFPSDLAALNDLGTLLHSSGYRTAARTAYQEAVARHPGDAMSRVNLASVLYEDGDPAAAREHYQAALSTAPEHPEAHQGLSYVLADLGDEASAAWHRQRGFRDGAIRTLPYSGSGAPVSLLLLISAKGGNIPVRNFLDDSIFETTVLAPEFFDLSMPLPEHELIFNSIGDADLAGPALEAARKLTNLSNAPVINAPRAVAVTGRSENAKRLAGIPGVIAPVTVSLPREVLSSHGLSLPLSFPLLLRSPGFHTGRHFVLVESARELAGAAATLPGDELTAIQYLDSRDADGKTRKYRVMMIDGRLYPLHAAISSHWKIHYFTAQMAESAQHRAEDAEFLRNMPGVLGPRAMAALEQIQRTLGLDYAGIDFGMSAAGDLLLFETNATMVVNPPEPDARWDYRRPAVEQILSAVRRMLLRGGTARNHSDDRARRRRSHNPATTTATAPPASTQ